MQEVKYGCGCKAASGDKNAPGRCPMHGNERVGWTSLEAGYFDLRADMKALAVAARDVSNAIAGTKEQWVSLREAIDRPGVQAVLEGVKDG